MRVLVTAGSRHGSTLEIASALSDVIARPEIETVDQSIDEARTLSSVELTGFDGFVVGSAIFAGRWLESPRRFLERLTPRLRGRPLWLFSSGPLGPPPYPRQVPVDVLPMLTAVSNVRHRVFPGRLDRSLLSQGEDAVVLALRAPEGDFRNWDDVRAWGESIAGQLTQAPSLSSEYS